MQLLCMECPHSFRTWLGGSSLPFLPGSTHSTTLPSDPLHCLHPLHSTPLSLHTLLSTMASTWLPYTAQGLEAVACTLRLADRTSLCVERLGVPEQWEGRPGGQPQSLCFYHRSATDCNTLLSLSLSLHSQWLSSCQVLCELFQSTPAEGWAAAVEGVLRKRPLVDVKASWVWVNSSSLEAKTSARYLSGRLRGLLYNPCPPRPCRRFSGCSTATTLRRFSIWTRHSFPSWRQRLRRQTS